MFLTGCGAGVTGILQEYGEFEPYVQQIVELGMERGRSLPGLRSVPIRFAPLDPGETGRCQWDLLSHREILLDETYWGKASDGTRLALLLHEVGHCVYKRDHDATKVKRQDSAAAEEEIPKSLMHPNGVSGKTFEDHRTYYLDELFS